MTKQQSVETLQAELDSIKAMLGLGARGPVRPQDKPNYIEPGSERHAAFLGLAMVREGDDVTGYTLYTSPKTKQVYHLEDETAPLSLYPGMDPEKAIIAVLRQKVNVLESMAEGPPPLPPNTPSMWAPVDQYTTAVRV